MSKRFRAFFAGSVNGNLAFQHHLAGQLSQEIAGTVKNQNRETAYQKNSELKTQDRIIVTLPSLI